MTNHKSTEKRIRSNGAKKDRNRYQAKTTRNALKELRTTKDKKAAEKLLPEVTAMLDKMAKNNIIHKNKASNLKSSIARHVNTLK